MSPDELLEGLGGLGYTRSLTRTTDITILESGDDLVHVREGVLLPHNVRGVLIGEQGGVNRP